MTELSFFAFNISDAISQLALLALVLSLAFTLQREKRRLLATKPARFWLVAGLNGLAVITLAAWLLQLSTVYHYHPHITLDSDKALAQQQDPALLLLDNPNASTMTVTGFGLTEPQWRPFDGIALDYQAPHLLPGPIEMQWPRHVLLGDAMSVSGRYQRQGMLDDIVTLKLLDIADTVVAQMDVKNNEAFTLVTRPKAAGYLAYRLQVFDNHKRLLQSEWVPVVVGQAPKAKILVVQSAPSFESKQLKNWAAANGASLLLMSQISTDRYLTQSVNMTEADAKRLSPALLADVDLLLMDGRALMQMPSVQQTWLIEAVFDGLGIYVMADKSLLNSKPALLADFDLSAKSGVLLDSAVTIPRWPGNKSDVAFDFMPYLLSAKDGKALLTSTKNEVLSIYQQQGLGKVALSILKDRYKWRLNGDHQTYSHYWQRLLSTLARGRSDSRIVAAANDHLSLVNQRQQVCVLSDKAGLKLMLDDGQTQSLPLAQNRFNTNQYCAFYWPQHSGWQHFTLLDEQGQLQHRSYRYTFDAKQWISWQQQRRVRDTQAQMKRPTDRQQGLKSVAYQSVNVAIYWWVLLVCGGLLWWERKF